jgi:arylsulfatase A-like enzyme
MEGAGRSPEARAALQKHKLATFQDRLDYVKSTSDNNETLAQFREFLDLTKGKPFSLQLCSSDPHRPLTTSGPQKHDPKTIRLPAQYPDTQLLREDFARYYDEISHFDGFFGQVMQVLDDRQIASNTVVVFMGDNGASQPRGKGTLYEFGIRVPLLVRWSWSKATNYRIYR